MSTQSSVPAISEGNFGPAMKALKTDRQRAFVLACIVNPKYTNEGGVNHTQAALDAGYAPGNPEAAQVTGSRLAHDELVQAAILEESQRRFGAALPLATATVLAILTDAGAKKPDRLKAAAMIFNRAGMPERTEHEVKVTRTESFGDKVERALRLAQGMGMSPEQIEKMMGDRGITLPGVKRVEISAPPAEIDEWIGE